MSADEDAPPGKTLEGGQLVDHRDGREVVLKLRGVRTQFGDHVVHDKLDLDVFRGEVVGLVGGSGTGKSVLLRTIIGLNPLRAGTIELLGINTRGRARQGRAGSCSRVSACSSRTARCSPRSRWPTTSSLPIREHAGLDEGLMHSIAALKIALVGLPPDTGGQEALGAERRHAQAGEPGPGPGARSRACCSSTSRPPASTRSAPPHYDELIGQLRQSLGLTVLMVTHDLDSLHAVCDRIAVLLDKRVVVGTMEEMLAYDHPWVREYFHGPRGRAALKQA